MIINFLIIITFLNGTKIANKLIRAVGKIYAKK
jgi:hypothetical protein